MLEQARTRTSAALGVNEKTLFFTSGGTEANHIPLVNLLSKPSGAGSILISSLEHPAVSAMAESLKTLGWRVGVVKANADGVVTAGAVRAALTADTRLVCVMAVHNETGMIQDVYGIADAITEFYHRKRRAKFHVDAVQAAGKIPFDNAYPGIDSASISAHKIGGPRGAGLLYLADGSTQNAFLRGGGQEGGVRSGTENLFGAWALSRCLERYYLRPNANDSSPAFERYRTQRVWTKEFITALKTIPGCETEPVSRATNSEDAASPWIVRASFAGIPGGVLLRALDAKGFAVSSGSACSSRKPQSALSPVRFSFGHRTAKADMDALFDAVREIARTLGTH
jgi:cysteine desulfurase